MIIHTFTNARRLTVQRLEAAPEARSLVISLAGGLYETPDRRSAHYLEEVRAEVA